MAKSYSPWANPAMHKSFIGRARSSAAGIHGDARTRRVRTRSASKARAIADSY